MTMLTDLPGVDTRPTPRPAPRGPACGCRQALAMPGFSKDLLDLSASLIVIASWQNGPRRLLIPRSDRQARARSTAFLRSCHDPIIALMNGMNHLHGGNLRALRRVLIDALAFEARIDVALQEALTLMGSRHDGRSTESDVVAVLDALRRIIWEVIWAIRDNPHWTQDIEDWRFWQSNVMHDADYEVTIQAHLDDDDWHARSPDKPYVSRA